MNFGSDVARLWQHNHNRPVPKMDTGGWVTIRSFYDIAEREVAGFSGLDPA